MHKIDNTWDNTLDAVWSCNVITDHLPCNSSRRGCDWPHSRLERDRYGSHWTKHYWHTNAQDSTLDNAQDSTSDNAQDI